MAKVRLTEIKKIWHQLSKNPTPDHVNLEMEIHRRLIDIFHPGDFYYYILHIPSAQMEYVSDRMTSVLGYMQNEFSVDLMFRSMHPDDLIYFCEFEKKVQDFFSRLPAEKTMKYKVNYDFRVRNKMGDYVRLLHQATTVQTNEEGGVIRVLGVHTDISNLKRENGSSLSFIGLEGEPSYKNILTSHRTYKADYNIPELTKRESEVLSSILEGKTSNEIAEYLFISKLTVDTHRRNILAKTNSRNMNELALKCLRENR